MVGTWRLGEIKTRPGTYFRRSSTGVTTAAATNGILACVFSSNFGALNRVVDLDQSDLNNLEDVFGTGATILREGFLGGATTIRAVRVGGDDGSCSSVVLKGLVSTSTTTDYEHEFTTSGTDAQLFDLPENFTTNDLTATSGTNDIKAHISVANNKITLAAAAFTNDLIVDNKFKLTWTKTIISSATVDAVEFSAKHPGDKAFTVTIRTNLITDERQLLVYVGTNIFDSVSFAAGDDEAQALVDALANNRNFTARKITAAPLMDVTQASMTGGVNPTVDVDSYSRATDMLERYQWNCLVADTDDVAVQKLLISFVKQSYETGHLGFACIAGKSTQDFDARLSFATGINDEKVVYVLSGWNDIDGTAYDGYLAAARIGGMIAAVETNNSLTHSTISNALDLIEPFTNGEITRAEQKGCLVLSLNADDQVQIDKAINTLVTVGNDMDEGWSKIRRTKTRFELMTRINQTCERLVGRLNNDSNGRSTIVAAMNTVINEMVAEKKLFFGSNAKEDPAHKPEADRAYFLINIGDIDSLEQFYLTYQFSFANPFEEV